MWNNAFDFDGKTKRRDFWIAFLINFVIVALFSALSGVAFIFKLIAILYGVIIIIPFIALGVRRLRDADLNPLLMLLLLIPAVGEIILIVLWCKE